MNDLIGTLTSDVSQTVIMVIGFYLIWKRLEEKKS